MSEGKPQRRRASPHKRCDVTYFSVPQFPKMGTMINSTYLTGGAQGEREEAPSIGHSLT